MRTALSFGLAMTATLLFGPVASAVNPSKSRLTAIDLKVCKQLSRHRDGGAWRCPGLSGYPVYYAEGDLREMLSFGEGAERRRSASQTLGPFNSIFEGKIRPTVEWRVAVDQKGREQPYATIVRYHTTRDNDRGEVLVITKVDSRNSCRLAKIDALATPEAIALAREWADANARLLPCPDEPQVLGKSGKSPM